MNSSTTGNIDRRGEQITWKTSGTRLRQDQLRHLQNLLLEERRWETLIPHLRKYRGQKYSELQNKVFYKADGAVLLNVWLTELPTMSTMYDTFNAAGLTPLAQAIQSMVGGTQQTPSPPQSVGSLSASSSTSNLSDNVNMSPLSNLEHLRHFPRGANPPLLTGGRLATFTLDKIKKMTNNFDPNQRLGEGYYGVVYRGQVENSEQIVAVKRLHGNQMTEFQLSTTYFRLHHENIVSLLATCRDTNVREYILVYEYMEKGDLAHHLCQPDLKLELDYRRRFHLAEDVIRGLSYINKTRNEQGKHLVHRDIKSANILLDANYRAKIGDFGASTLAIRGTGNTMEQPETKVIGTREYLAPELLANNPTVSTKVDTYSFGIVVFELCFGLLAKDHDDFVQKAMGPNRPPHDIEWRMEIEPSQFNVFDFLHQVGTVCTRTNWELRPMTSDIELAFQNRELVLNTNSQPHPQTADLQP